MKGVNQSEAPISRTKSLTTTLPAVLSCMSVFTGTDCYV